MGKYSILDAVGSQRGIFQDKDKDASPKCKRAQRANLTSFSFEQKQERRKERARVYSAIARDRQDVYLKELKLRVEALTVYKLLISEAPDVVVVLSPTREATVLYANDASSRVFRKEPQALISRYVCQCMSMYTAVASFLLPSLLSRD